MFFLINKFFLGSIYLIGGLNPEHKEQSLNQCYEYNWKQQTLSMIKPLLIGRNSFGIAFCNNCIYVAGGISDIKNKNQLDNYESNDSSL